MADLKFLIFIFICNYHIHVLCIAWVGGRLVGLGFVCNLLGMVLGIFFPLELFMTTRFSLFAWYMYYNLNYVFFKSF